MPSLIKYPHRASPRTDPPHHLSTYRLALALSIPLIFSVLLFWICSHRDPALVIYYDFLPIAYIIFLFGAFLLPIRRFSFAGRSRFLAILRRVSIGGIAEAKDGKFGDILLADVLTSYSKPIADLFVSFCMFFTTDGSATARPDRGCGGEFLVPILIAVPYLIRFRQCMIEYFRVRASNQRSGGLGSSGWGGQHLANALKYSTAFPVIIFSALQRHLSNDHSTIGLTETSLYRCWVVAVFVNSLYSFYWDVAKDWDLTFFSPGRKSHMHPYGLRQRLLFPGGKRIYYVAVAIDLVLRFTWSMKLSPHLDHFADFESGIFLMSLMEVFRRWMWIFLRVETEWVRSTDSSRLGTDGQDDVLLDNYGNGGNLLGDIDSMSDDD